MAEKVNEQNVGVLQLKWYQRLSFRVGAMAAGLATAALAVATIVAGVYTEQALVEAEYEKIEAVGSLVGGSVAAYVAMEEAEAAIRALEEVAPAIPGLLKISIYYRDGGEFVVLVHRPMKEGETGLFREAPIIGDLGTVRVSVSRAAVTAAAGRSWRNLLLVLVIGVVVVLLIAAFVGDRAARMLRQMAHIARAVAEGDLSQTVPVGGGASEISILAGSLNSMVGNLRELVEALALTVAEVGSVAGESLATTERQAAGTKDQTRAADKTRDATETLVISGEQIHEASLEVVANSETALANNRTSAERTSDLETIAFKMGDLLQSVRDIAEKTEMLALNASLEGVRAQEHGAGFILVATEMQRLSESVLQAVLKMQELTMEMRDHAFASTAVAGDGIRLAEGTTVSARLIGSLVGDLQVGMSEVESEMTQVTGTAVSVAAGSAQIADAMRSLVDLAGRLQTQIEVFKTGDRA